MLSYYSPAVSVSTHSRAEAAATRNVYKMVLCGVSTHSRAEAAAYTF